MVRRRKLIGLVVVAAVAALSAVALAWPWEPEYPSPSHWEGWVRHDIHPAWGEHHYQLLVPCLPTPQTACQPGSIVGTYQLVPLSTQVGQKIRRAATNPLLNWASIDGFWVSLGAPPHNGTIFVQDIKIGPPPADVQDIITDPPPFVP